MSYSDVLDPAFASAELNGRCFESSMFYDDILAGDETSALEGLNVGKMLSNAGEVIKTIFNNIIAAFKRFFDKLFNLGGCTMHEGAWKYGRVQCELLMDKAQKFANEISTAYTAEKDLTSERGVQDQTFDEIKTTMTSVKEKVKSLATADQAKTAYMKVNRSDYNKFLQDIKNMSGILINTTKKEIPRKDNGDSYQSYYAQRATQLARLASELSNFFMTISFICRKADNKVTEEA